VRKTSPREGLLCSGLGTSSLQCLNPANPRKSQRIRIAAFGGRAGGRDRHPRTPRSMRRGLRLPPVREERSRVPKRVPESAHMTREHHPEPGLTSLYRAEMHSQRAISNPRVAWFESSRGQLKTLELGGLQAEDRPGRPTWSRIGPG